MTENCIIQSVFQQDNALFHKARIIKEFSAARQWGISKWPPSSLDLNTEPIEVMGAKIRKR